MKGGESRTQGWKEPLLNRSGSEHVDVEQGGGESLSIDTILSKYVGDFGFAQQVHFVMVSLAWCLEGIHTLVTIFADRKPEWQCRPPLDSASTSSLALGGLSMICTPKSSLCSMDPSVWEWVGGRGVSTVSQWSLICGDEYKVGVAQAAFFLGAFMGAGLFGHFSDSRAGRKGALFLACACTGLVGLMTASAREYWVYVGFRWLTGVMASGIGLASFVLAMEPVGPSKRGRVGMSAFYFFSLGIMSLPLFAYFSTTSWRHLYLLTSLPALFYCALILPTVYESPRWFVVQGRVQEAMDVLRVFAKRNGSCIPEGVEVKIENEDDSDDILDWDGEDGDNPKLPVKAASGSLLMVLKNPGTRPRMLIMVVVWFLTSVVYYGINLNVGNLGTNLYMGVILNAVIEWPAFFLTAILLDRIGRRFMLMSTMLVSGLSCLTGSLLFVIGPDGSGALFKSLRIVCSAAGIFGMAGTYNLVYIYTSELFPTVVRNAALGLTTQASGMGSVIAPAVVVAGRYHKALPFAIFGAMAVAGSTLSVFLPETLHQGMFETLEGLDKGEKIASAQRIMESEP